MHSTDFTSQGDHKVRVVTLANLLAMCENASGIVHTYEVVGAPSAYRVSVVYSNPDEYGNEVHVLFRLPVYPNDFEPRNPFVVMVVASAVGGRNTFDREAAWQTFDAAVLSGPELFRTAPRSNDWRTREEIDAERAEHEELIAAEEEQVRQGREIDNEWERSQ